MKQEEYNNFFENCDNILFNNSKEAKIKKRKIIEKANKILDKEDPLVIEQYFNAVYDTAKTNTFNTGFIHYCAFLGKETFNKAIEKGLDPNIFYSDNIIDRESSTLLYHTPLIFCLYNGFDNAFKYVLEKSDLNIYPENKDQLYLTFAESLDSNNLITNDISIRTGINLLKQNIGMPEKQINHYKLMTELIVKCDDINTIINLEDQGFIFEPKRYNDIYTDKKLINEIDNNSLSDDRNINKLKYLIQKGFALQAKQSHKQTNLMYLNMLGNKDSHKFQQTYSIIKDKLNSEDKQVLMMGFKKNTNEGFHSYKIIKNYEDKKNLEQSTSHKKINNKKLL